jgi:hypothetical protein
MFSNPDFTSYGQVYKIIHLLACAKKCLMGDLENGGLVLGGVTGLCSSEGYSLLRNLPRPILHADKTPKNVTLRNVIMSLFWGGFGWRIAIGLGNTRATFRNQSSSKLKRGSYQILRDREGA